MLSKDFLSPDIGIVVPGPKAADLSFSVLARQKFGVKSVFTSLGRYVLLAFNPDILYLFVCLLVCFLEAADLGQSACQYPADHAYQTLFIL